MYHLKTEQNMFKEQAKETLESLNYIHLMNVQKWRVQVLDQYSNGVKNSLEDIHLWRWNGSNQTKGVHS